MGKVQETLEIKGRLELYPGVPTTELSFSRTPNLLPGPFLPLTAFYLSHTKNLPALLWKPMAFTRTSGQSSKES